MDYFALAPDPQCGCCIPFFPNIVGPWLEAHHGNSRDNVGRALTRPSENVAADICLCQTFVRTLLFPWQSLGLQSSAARTFPNNNIPSPDLQAIQWHHFTPASVSASTPRSGSETGKAGGDERRKRRGDSVYPLPTGKGPWKAAVPRPHKVFFRFLSSKRGVSVHSECYFCSWMETG